MSVIEVAIGPGGASGRFRVEVVRSPAGEASEVVRLDVAGLLSQRSELELAVLASSVSSRRVLAETERCVREVGQVLFGALLGSGEVMARYRASAALATERGEGLGVVLRIDEPTLAGLPWEAMYDDALGSYVCRRDHLLRHVAVPALAPPLAVNPPLRILGVISSPRGLVALDADQEKALLSQALDRLCGEGMAKLAWAPSATWAGLQDVLLDGQWHVLHFIGHGDFDVGRGEGVLALVGDDGRASLVEASRLVDLLRQARPMPRLVVLNSCAGAVTGADDVFSGMAEALVRGGVNAVAAMQYAISDQAAVAFARGFYSALAQGRGVDDAMSSGRVAILGISGQTLEWVTPVLYLRGPGTQLFTVPEYPAGGGSLVRAGQPSPSTQPGRESAGKGALYAVFFERFLEQLRARHPGWSQARKGPTDNWLSIPSPFGGLGYYCVSFPSGQRLRCELYLDWADPARVREQYDELYRHRVAIEARFGGELTWERLESKRASRVAIVGSGSVEQTERHQEFIDWFLTSLERLRAVLDPYARASPRNDR